MIEDDLRTMLRRRADDITVEPRPWTELEDAPRVRLARPAGTHRWLPAAAVFLVVVMAAGLLVRASTDDPAVPVQQVPSLLPFDPATAAPVWWAAPAGINDVPASMAEAYLFDRLGRSPGTIEVDQHGDIAAARWASGTVHLRRLDDARDGYWVVVGSIDTALSFGPITYRDDLLRFTITAPAVVAPLQVSVVVNGQSVGLGGPELTPPDAVADPEVGQTFWLLPGEPQEVRTSVPMPVDGAPVVRVRQIKDTYVTVAEFVVQPEGGPAGGRLLTSGKLANKTWRLWAMDRSEGTDETPCVVLTLVAKTVGGPVCGVGAGNPADRSYFSQIGPVAQELEQVLIFGVVDAAVGNVLVRPEASDTNQIATTFADPVHPGGARMFAATVPGSDRSESVELLGDQLRTLEQLELRVDGQLGS